MSQIDLVCRVCSVPGKMLNTEEDRHILSQLGVRFPPPRAPNIISVHWVPPPLDWISIEWCAMGDKTRMVCLPLTLRSMKFRVSHIYREGNCAADALANYGRTSTIFQWWSCIPDFFFNLHSQDLWVEQFSCLVAVIFCFLKDSSWFYFY